jgi:hypothetical protein
MERCSMVAPARLPLPPPFCVRVWHVVMQRGFVARDKIAQHGATNSSDGIRARATRIRCSRVA